MVRGKILLYGIYTFNVIVSPCIISILDIIQTDFKNADNITNY